ncbi:MAG TPA: hypothetical protein VNB23_00505 [Ramlibacter sp.]|nr:hypothetical protein [Ramlibacter sp.]
MRTPTHSSWLWGLPLVLVGGAVGLGAMHREKPLMAADLPSEAVRQLRWPAGAETAWREIRYETLRTISLSGAPPVEVTVEHRLQNLGDGLVRRSDNYYPRNGGGALVHEERYLLYSNLFGLHSRVREPAPVFHLIFDDAGWFDTRLEALDLQLPEVAPADPGWLLKGRLTRSRDAFPQGTHGVPRPVTRDLGCRRSGDSGSRPAVACTFQDSDELRLESRFVYVQEVGLYFLASSDQTVPQEADRRQSVRLSEISVDGRRLPL